MCHVDVGGKSRLTMAANVASVFQWVDIPRYDTPAAAAYLQTHEQSWDHGLLGLDVVQEQLTQHLTSHKECTPLLVVGDFNALALDELAALPHAVGRHFVPGKTAEDDQADNTEEGETNQRRFLDLLSSQDYCLPQSLMENAPQHRHTHKRLNGNMVQLDHAIIHKDWRSIVHNIHTIPGGALNSNHYLVKVDLLLKTKAQTFADYLRDSHWAEPPTPYSGTSYYLFAKILHTRLQPAIDDRLRDTQFGFRAARSTLQPIHIIRRLIERAGATGQALGKAFDKIHLQALLTVLDRFGAPYMHFSTEEER
ncbi:crop [Symbiodinium microadriaticum]|nr:crop [Symbiodinium microadriaticum]